MVDVALVDCPNDLPTISARVLRNLVDVIQLVLKCQYTIVIDFFWQASSRTQVCAGLYRHVQIEMDGKFVMVVQRRF